jgi:hypothetical protein
VRSVSAFVSCGAPHKEFLSLQPQNKFRRLEIYAIDIEVSVSLTFAP